MDPKADTTYTFWGPTVLWATQRVKPVTAVQCVDNYLERLHTAQEVHSRGTEPNLGVDLS